MSMFQHDPSPLAGEGGASARQSVGGRGGASRLAAHYSIGAFFGVAKFFWLADASRPHTQPSPARGEGFETVL
jgi:hypothetical protein